MIKQRITKGAILEVTVNERYYYAQILHCKNYVFFDYVSNERLYNFEILQDKLPLFFIGVYDDIITSGEWLKVGKLPIRKEFEIVPNQYIQHTGEKIEFEIYNPNTGVIVAATREQCIDLECCAVWDKKHVEERLDDYYNGKLNKWVEDMKIK
ncbi:MAG: immunity 26/phosphotriesterase HocA family protein [Paludibacteraceae bacterium]|nr:hypothetical protein [Candidatus Physcocola equi]MCQ2234895.1 immunity 26/phosphotriesterase HocA family protein [Paludibacteraceae bacterium]